MAKQSRPTRATREKAEKNEFTKRARELGIEIVGNRAFVTTSRGVEVECLPVAHVVEALTNQTRDRFSKINPEPPIPTRKIEGVPGSVVETPYDEKTILDDDVPQEDKDAWALHQAWETELRSTFGEQLVRMLATIGTSYDMPEDDEWIKDAEFVGLDVPDDPRERKMFYFTTFVLGNQKDGYTLAQGVYAASGFNEALTTTIEDSFQS